jgi:hypothetical protein
MSGDLQADGIGLQGTQDPKTGLGSDTKPRGSARAGDFWLHKWYLDATDGDGNVFIGYWAAARWNRLSLHFHQLLLQPAAGMLRSIGGFATQPEPAWRNEGLLEWCVPDMYAEWQASRSEAIAEKLLTNPAGEISWHCHQPRAQAHVEMPGFRIKGWGYVECIDITIPAWRLPLRTLYWGRCHSANHYLVWIKWEGSSHRSLLWHNGQRIEEFELSETGIQAAAVAFAVEQSRAVRQGAIGAHVFSLPGGSNLHIPKKALRIFEHKMYGSGQIVTKSSSEPASAIYETVTL